MWPGIHAEQTPDKPAVINLEQLDEIERTQRETGRIWCLYSNEHYDRRCTLKAGELVEQFAFRVLAQLGLPQEKQFRWKGSGKPKS